MIERLDVPVTVAVVFDHRTRQINIKRVTYDGRDYAVTKINHQEKRRDGRILLHVIHAQAEGCYFKLVLNTDALQWRLEEVRFHVHATD